MFGYNYISQYNFNTIIILLRSFFNSTVIFSYQPYRSKHLTLYFNNKYSVNQMISHNAERFAPMVFMLLQQSDLLLWETYYGYNGEFMTIARQTK